MCIGSPDLFDTYIETKEAISEIDAINGAGYTALMLAASHSSNVSTVEVVKKLITTGANLEKVAAFGYTLGCTVLHISAVISNHTSSLETVRVLLDAKANVNALNSKGYTPIMFAAGVSNLCSSDDTVQLLLQYGAKVGDECINFRSTALENSLRGLTVPYPYTVAGVSMKTLSTEETAEMLMEAGDTLSESAIADSSILKKYYEIASRLILKQNLQLQYRESFKKMIQHNDIGLETLVKQYL